MTQRRVLVVDDEAHLRLLIAKRYKHYADRFEVVTAANGKQALEWLELGGVDLVITDLRMPEMDGFELLAHMSRRFNAVPVMVMTAFNSPEIEAHLARRHLVELIEKPIDFKEMTEAIERTLEALDEQCTVKGISLPNFLQLINMEEKSCRLEIATSRGEKGRLYTENGELFDAVYGDLIGEEAAYAMLALDRPNITIHPPPRQALDRRIHQDLMHILMEGLRRKDELAGEPPDGDYDPAARHEEEAPASISAEEAVPDGGIRVLVVDDSRVIRRAVTRYLEDCDGISVVGEAENGSEAMILNQGLRPDVITMDICMPVMDGLTALKHLMVQDPTPVVMLSTLTREGAWETFEALRLGAVDFVTKPNRLIASDVDVQLAQLEAKVRLANAVNRSGLHLLRPPSSGMHSRRERRREPARRLLVVAAVEGGCRAMLSALSVLAMEDGVGIVSVLEAEGVHLDAFAQYFCRFSRMPVVRPRPHQTIEAGVCYLVSANEAIAIATNGGAAAFKTTDGKSERHGKPADRMMADAAAVFGRHAAGLILCGSGGDGVVGLRAIKRAGGETMVPDPDACLFPDRVRRVIDSGLVDHVVPVRPSAD